jgi:hypothetical protein
LASREEDVKLRSSLSEALWVRSRLWWDEFEESDLHVGSHPYVPAADAMGCIGRWRLGKSRIQDIDDMTAVPERNPDALLEGLLGLAAAQLGNGSPVDSLRTLGRLETLLVTGAREDFSSRQLLDLTLAVRVHALNALHRVDEARALRSECRSRFTKGLLPAILVEDVELR